MAELNVVFDLELERYRRGLRLVERETQRTAQNLARVGSQRDLFQVNPRSMRQFSAEAGEALRRVGLLSTELRQLSQIKVGGLGISTARIDPERIVALAKRINEARERTAQLRVALRRTANVLREVGGALGGVGRARVFAGIESQLRSAERTIQGLQRQLEGLGRSEGPRRLAQNLVKVRERSAELRVGLRRTLTTARELGLSFQGISSRTTFNQVTTQLRQSEQAARRLQTRLNGLGRTGGVRRLNTQIATTERSLGRSSLLAGRLQTAIGAAFGAAGAGALLRSTVGAADALQRQVDALALVSGGQENAARLQEELFFLAQDTRVEFDGTVESYARLARSTEDLNATEEDRLTVIKTINQALQIGSKGVQEANAAQIQLSQGLASNRLSGDELRSVLENAPRLAIAIADGLNKGIGELRELGEQGALTTEVVFGALQNQAEVINREFQSTTVRVEQAVTKVGNALQRAFGSGNVDTLTESLTDLSLRLQEPETVEQLGQITTAISEIAALATQSIPPIIDLFGEFSGVVANLGNTWDDFAGQFNNFGGGALDAFLNPLGAFVDKTTESLGAINQVFAETEGGVERASQRRLAIIEENLKKETEAAKLAEVERVLAAEDAARDIVKVEEGTALERAKIAKQSAKDAVKAEKDAAREKIKIQRDIGREIEQLQKDLDDRAKAVEDAKQAQLARDDNQAFARGQVGDLRGATNALDEARRARSQGDDVAEKEALERARELSEGVLESAQSVEDLTIKKFLATQAEKVFQEATKGTIAQLEKVRDGVEELPDQKSVEILTNVDEVTAEVERLRLKLAELPAAVASGLASYQLAQGSLVGTNVPIGALTGEGLPGGRFGRTIPERVPSVQPLSPGGGGTAFLPNIPALSPSAAAVASTVPDQVRVQFNFESGEQFDFTGTPDAADGLSNALGKGALKHGRAVSRT